MRCPGVAQGREVPGRPVAVAEVLADVDLGGVQTVDEHARHELLGLPLRELLGEREHEGRLDTEVVEQVEPPRQVGQPEGCRVGVDDRHGVRVNVVTTEVAPSSRARPTTPATTCW